MAVYCVRGRVNTTSGPPFPVPTPAPAPAPSPTPAHHLQYMSAYDFPASECASASGWHNLYQANSLDEATACSAAAAAAGRRVTSLLNVEEVFFITGSPGLGDKGCDQVPGGCLCEDWQTRWAATAATVGPLVQKGSLLGFNLGDEYVTSTYD